MVYASVQVEPTLRLTSHLRLVDDPVSGLSGAIAVDSMVLGPAAGGCRFWSYASTAELHHDALRLAHGMTLKNAMAGLPFGGGKAVLQVPDRPFDRSKLFEAFGRFVNELAGDYVTAEDVGTTVADMEAIRRQTPFVAGLETDADMAGGDPSPWTALGVFLSMETAAKVVLNANLAEVRVAIQGAGNVGSRLAVLLAQAGAQVFVSDIKLERCDALHRLDKIQIVPPSEILSADADIFAPCALGGALNHHTVRKLKARLVCGGANNQIADPAAMSELVDRKIVYVPDFVANAGGIINVAAEYLKETTAQVDARVRLIPGRVRDVLQRSATERRSPAFVAEEMANEIIARGGDRDR